MIRFEEVAEEFITTKQKTPTVDMLRKVKDASGEQYFAGETKLPVRADNKSAGFDFFSPKSLMIAPGEVKLIFTDVKALMPDRVFLEVHIRSSMAIKHGIILANQVGIIDASYYNNPDNDGNIGIALRNISGKGYEIKKGDRIAQGIFTQYFTPEDEDKVIGEKRTGGFGSSGK